MFVSIIQTFFSDFQSYQHLIAVSWLKICLKASFIFDFVSSRSTKWRPMGAGAPLGLNRIATRNVFLKVFYLFLTFFFHFPHISSYLQYSHLFFLLLHVSVANYPSISSQKNRQCTMLRHWQSIWATIDSKYKTKIISQSSHFCPHLVFHRFWDSLSWWKWLSLEFTFSFFFSN